MKDDIIFSNFKVMPSHYGVDRLYKKKHLPKELHEIDVVFICFLV